MAEPYVRPDVRLFLDYLNNLPGPKTYEVGPVEARTMMVAVAPRRRRAGRRAGGDPRPRLPGPGRRDQAAAVRRPRDARAGAALPVPPRRRLRVRRPRHPRAVLRRDGARARHAGARRRLSARARASLAGRSRGCDRGGALGGGEPGGARPRGDRPGRLPATAPAAISRSSSRLALRDEPAGVPVLAQWPIYPAADPGKGYPSKEDFGEGYLLTKLEHGLVRAMLLRRRRATGAMRRW